MSATDSTDTTTATEADAEKVEDTTEKGSEGAEKSTEKPEDVALGENGEKALKAEREARKALEKQLADAKKSQQGQIDAILKAAGLKTDEEVDPAKITAELEESRRVAAENAAALTRYQTAVEKQVPAHLMEFVGGSTREEVEASIEKVLAAFAASKPTGPQPDPSQGQQGAPTSLDAQIAAAEKAGNTREVIRLKARKGMTATTN